MENRGNTLVINKLDFIRYTQREGKMLNKIIFFIVVVGIGMYGCGKDEEERKERGGKLKPHLALRSDFFF